jgi:hypothetical protein
MDDHEHSTTAATLGTLPDPVRTAVLERATAAQLPLRWHDPAYLTRSRRLRKPGMFARLTGTADRGTEHLTALVLGGDDLLVATHDEQRGMVVLAARLEDVEVASAVDRLATARGDNGITVTGFPVAVEGVTSRGSLFVGLGPPDGHHGHAALDAAVGRAKA